MKRHIRYSENERALFLLDQRYLPQEEKWFVCRRTKDVVLALQKMVVRGAPAIGVVAAYGCCLAAASIEQNELQWQEQLEENLTRIERARPTAVNLQWAVKKMREFWKTDPDIQLNDLLWVWNKMAKEIHSEDIAANMAMGRIGMQLLKDGDTIMTHCNAGALATGGYGTALGVIRAAKTAGKSVRVIANETRPFLQGARLTAYELQQDDIPVWVACDNAVALLMYKGMVDVVIVGADRIAANGDTANKIGTYALAVLADRHNIPFYVAAPLSTFDTALASGRDIPIEERPVQEVTQVCGQNITPAGVPVYNFAFDITPHDLIKGIITEKALLQAPYEQSVQNVFSDL